MPKLIIIIIRKKYHDSALLQMSSHRNRLSVYNREQLELLENEITYSKKTTKVCPQHLLFPGGHPSKYWASPTLLNFSDQSRTRVFSVVW